MKKVIGMISNGSVIAEKDLPLTYTTEEGDKIIFEQGFFQLGVGFCKIPTKIIDKKECEQIFYTEKVEDNDESSEED